jgi:DNA replication protein DnaC
MRPTRQPLRSSYPVRNYAQWLLQSQRDEADERRRLANTYIPEQFWGVSWDSYQTGTTCGGEELLGILLHYSRTYPTDDDTDGIVLLGAAGLGKTFGLQLLGLDLAAQGLLVKYVTEAGLRQRRLDLMQVEREGDSTGDWQPFNTAKASLVIIEQECDVLILDDVGKAYRVAREGNATDASLDNLLRTRVAARKTTLVSSNTPLVDWKKFDPSLTSFLYAVGEVLELDETSTPFRGQGSIHSRRVARRGEG